TRIRNQRRKMLDQSQEVARLEAVIRALEIRVERKGGGTPADAAAAADVLPFALPVVTEATTPSAGESSNRDEAAVEQPQVESLEKLSETLADQRLQLAEQFQKLVEGQQRWQQEREDTALQLEAAVHQLRNREEAMLVREQNVVPMEERVLRHQQESNEIR